MRRSHRFFHALGSGYLVALVMSVLGFITLPIALASLGKELFGIGAAILQTTGFLGLFDFGVASSTARYIVDHKDRRDGPEYDAFLKAVFSVALVQAALLLALSPFLTALASHIFDVPSTHTALFRQVLHWTIGATALGIVANPLNQILYANQRGDILNYATLAANVASTGALLLALHLKLGLYAYAISTWVSFLILIGGTWWHTRRLGLFPRLRSVAGAWSQLPELLRYAGNVFLVTLGGQLITIAPAVLVSRIFGAAALADWTAGTRLANVALQLISRVPLASEPAFWEMWSRAETRRLSERLPQIARLAAVAAAAVGGGLVALNAPFVALWTSGRVEWVQAYDFGAAVWLLCSVLSVTWNMVPGITKRLGIMRYAYLGEGILLFLPALFHLRLPYQGWVFWILILAAVLGRLNYGSFRVRRDLGISAKSFGAELLRLALLAGVLLGAGWLAANVGRSHAGLSQILISGLVYTPLPVWLLWQFGLPVEMRDKIARGTLQLIGSARRAP